MKTATIFENGVQIDHEIFDENTTFIQYDRQDNMVKNLFYSTLSSGFLNYLFDKKEKLEYWNALVKAFNDDS